MRYVWYILLAYILYQFIFKLVVPVYMATRKIKKGFREMHENMQQQANGQQGFTPQPSATGSETKPRSAPKAGEYIDFEEVES